MENHSTRTLKTIVSPVQELALLISSQKQHTLFSAKKKKNVNETKKSPENIQQSQPMSCSEAIVGAMGWGREQDHSSGNKIHTQIHTDTHSSSCKINKTAIDLFLHISYLDNWKNP